MPPTGKSTETIADEHGILPSHGIAVDLPTGDGARPSSVRHVYDVDYTRLTVARLMEAV